MENYRVGQRISEARSKLGMSTQQLAENINKSQATVSRIENGKQGVTLPLLSKIARVLKTHPFSLLGHNLYEGKPKGLQGVLLHEILTNGRKNCKLELDAAAKQANLPLSCLNEIEQGKRLPDDVELSNLCTLYSLDQYYVSQLLRAEKEYPELATKLSVMNTLLADCLQIIEKSQEDSSKSHRLLKERIEDCLAFSSNSSEREGSYYSLGHISNKLLSALQDPQFHNKAEALADQWVEKGDEKQTESECYTDDNSADSNDCTGAQSN